MGSQQAKEKRVDAFKEALGPNPDIKHYIKRSPPHRPKAEIGDIWAFRQCVANTSVIPWMNRQTYHAAWEHRPVFSYYCRTGDQYYAVDDGNPLAFELWKKI
jgi:hypothetical protein